MTGQKNFGISFIIRRHKKHNLKGVSLSVETTCKCFIFWLRLSPVSTADSGEVHAEEALFQ